MNNPVNRIDPFGLKTWIFIVAAGGGGIGPFAGEGGTYYLVDPSTGAFHHWLYGSGGFGITLVAGGAAQIEAGLYEAPIDPTQMSSCSLTVSGFAAAGKGYSGQFTGTSFWGEGEGGSSAGFAGGLGAGVSGMFTYSYYLGKGNVLPEKYRTLYEKIYKEFFK